MSKITTQSKSPQIFTLSLLIALWVASVLGSFLLGGVVMGHDWSNKQRIKVLDHHEVQGKQLTLAVLETSGFLDDYHDEIILVGNEMSCLKGEIDYDQLYLKESLPEGQLATTGVIQPIKQNILVRLKNNKVLTFPLTLDSILTHPSSSAPEGAPKFKH